MNVSQGLAQYLDITKSRGCFRKGPDLDAVHVREPETECLRAALEAALDSSSKRHDEESPGTRYIVK